MKGYNTRGKIHIPNKKVKCKYKPMLHTVEHVRGSDLRILNQQNKAEQEKHE